MSRSKNSNLEKSLIIRLFNGHCLALVASIGKYEADKMVAHYEKQKRIINDPEKFLEYEFNY